MIEVNSCPALGRSGRYLKNLLPRVTEEAFQKVKLDPYSCLNVYLIDNHKRLLISNLN